MWSASDGEEGRGTLIYYEKTTNNNQHVVFYVHVLHFLILRIPLCMHTYASL